MNKFFWVLAVLALGSVPIVGRLESGDWETVKTAWQGPEGAIVATGLPPQIELIEQVADEYGWAVKCTAQSGELTLVELTPTFWAKFEQQDDLLPEITILATSSVKIAQSSGSAAQCGRGWLGQDMVIGGALEGQEIPIALGNESELAPFMQSADRCGFDDLALRRPTAEEKEWIGDDFSPDMRVLSATSTESNVYRLICLNALASRQGEGE